MTGETPVATSKSNMRYYIEIDMRGYIEINMRCYIEIEVRRHVYG